jgi:hypothetical protein
VDLERSVLQLPQLVEEHLAHFTLLRVNPRKGRNEKNANKQAIFQIMEKQNISEFE